MIPWRTKWFICRSAWIFTPIPTNQPTNQTKKIGSKNCPWFRAGSSSFSEDKILSFLLYLRAVCSAYLTRKKLLEGKQRIHSIQKAYPCITELRTYWNIQYYKGPHCKLDINVANKYWLLSIILPKIVSKTYCIINCSNIIVTSVTNICSEHFFSQHCFFKSRNQKTSNYSHYIS